MQELVPEQVYQQAFDTHAANEADGKQIAFLPWEAFLPVRMASVDESIPPLDEHAKSRITSLGIVLSKLELEDYPNPTRPREDFSIKVHEIGGFRQPRPSVISFSSCGTERNALLRSAEERKQEVPIVQLNPSNILNYKFAGESAVRSMHTPLHTIVRMVGLTTVEEHAEAGNLPLHITQGDCIVGSISRAEAARVAAVASVTPGAAGKSIDCRREPEAQQKLQQQRQQQKQDQSDANGKLVELSLPRQDDQSIAWAMANLAADHNRPKVGVRPIPRAKLEVEGSLTEEEQQEVLNREEVQRSAQEGRGGRVRGEE